MSRLKERELKISIDSKNKNMNKYSGRIKRLYIIDELANNSEVGVLAQLMMFQLNTELYFSVGTPDNIDAIMYNVAKLGDKLKGVFERDEYKLGPGTKIESIILKLTDPDFDFPKHEMGDDWPSAVVYHVKNEYLNRVYEELGLTSDLDKAMLGNIMYILSNNFGKLYTHILSIMTGRAKDVKRVEVQEKDFKKGVSLVGGIYKFLGAFSMYKYMINLPLVETTKLVELTEYLAALYNDYDGISQRVRRQLMLDRFTDIDLKDREGDDREFAAETMIGFIRAEIVYDSVTTPTHVLPTYDAPVDMFTSGIMAGSSRKYCLRELLVINNDMKLQYNKDNRISMLSQGDRFIGNSTGLHEVSICGPSAYGNSIKHMIRVHDAAKIYVEYNNSLDIMIRRFHKYSLSLDIGTTKHSRVKKCVRELFKISDNITEEKITVKNLIRAACTHDTNADALQELFSDIMGGDKQKVDDLRRVVVNSKYFADALQRIRNLVGNFNIKGNYKNGEREWIDAFSVSEKSKVLEKAYKLTVHMLDLIDTFTSADKRLYSICEAFQHELSHDSFAYASLSDIFIKASPDYVSGNHVERTYMVKYREYVVSLKEKLRKLAIEVSDETERQVTNKNGLVIKIKNKKELKK